MTDSTTRTLPMTAAGRFLANAAAVAVSLSIAVLLFALLRSGAHSAIQDLFHGESDAALFKTAAATTILLAGSVLLVLANRRLAFQAVVGLCMALAVVAALYRFLSSIAVLAVCLGVAAYMYKRRFYSSPINKWAAVAICVPVYSLTLIFLLARLRLLMLD